MLQTNFPIIDLHCHLEGSIDPQKSYEILHRVGYAPAQIREEFFKNVTGFESGRQGFFGALPLLDACLINRTAVIEVVSDIIIRAAEQNVKILEMSLALAPGCEHTLRRLLHAGVKVTINADDPGVQNCTWRDDYAFAIQQLGLTEYEINHCLQNAFEASFLPPQKRKRSTGRRLLFLVKL